ncbi:hypothetical protein [Paraburkholderia sp. BCC1884]|uniref:hypothetical protein n=1 Tax=Paraburkholderia sp. BCC1884 TaxID=2562668 RepID=UPI001184492C|nr:hypothetical protein [Paraburkholderia sp. BCC1884]
MATQTSAAKEKLVTAVVRKGTVYTEATTNKGWDHTLNKEIDVTKAAGARGPGEIVQLPSAEVERLTRLGFLGDVEDDEAPLAPDTSVSMLKLLDRSEVGFARKSV